MRITRQQVTYFALGTLLTVSCQVFADDAPETPMERTARILREANAKIARPQSPPTFNYGALPQPATTLSPSELAQKLSQQPLLTAVDTNQTDLMVFVSFSMPPASLNNIVIQSELTGARLVFRGMKGDKLSDMSKAIAALIGNHRVEVIIHPPAFKQFRITQVPALVIAKGGSGEQLSPDGCSQPERYVKVTGDVTQDYALDFIERTSPQWASVAGFYNNKLKPRY